MAGENEAQAALRPDTATGTTHSQVATEGPVRLVLKPDRRQNRVVTPDCPRCQRRACVTVCERSRVALGWYCTRCDWSWSQLLRQQSEPSGETPCPTT
jgi:hypothetical protein